MQRPLELNEIVARAMRRITVCDLVPVEWVASRAAMIELFSNLPSGRIHMTLCGIAVRLDHGGELGEGQVLALRSITREQYDDEAIIAAQSDDG